VDAFHRFLKVELSRLPVDTGTVPVVHPIGGVGVLLDFINEQARPDGVEATARDENVIPFSHRDGMDAGFGPTRRERFAERFPVDPLAQAHVEYRSRSGGGDVPDLALRLSPELRGDLRGRMDLEGELVPRV